MATKEITKRESQYPGPELEPELVLEEQVQTPGRTVAKLALLWEHRQFLFRRAAIGLVAFTIIAFLIPARFSSTTRLMPPDQAGQGMASMLAALGKGGGDLGGIGGELLGLKTTGDMFIGVLHSRTVADQLISKFDLRKLYGVRRYEDARKVLDGHTEISSDRKSGIITVMVSDSNPDRAAAMGREYVEALNRMVTTLNTSSAHKERVFLEERLVQVQQGLEDAEKDFSQFASKNTAIDVKEQGRAMIGAAAELEGQLIAAETELEGLRQIYTPENVRVRSLQARIQEYRRQLQKLGGKTPDNVGVASSPSGESAEPAQDLYPSIRQLPILGVTWADLYRRTRVQEAVFETLTKQYELAKVEEARETPSVKVLDIADVPEHKSYPPRLFLMIMGSGFIFITACVWVLARARWQEVDPQHPAKALAQEVLRTIATTWPLQSQTSAKIQSTFQRVSHPFRGSDSKS
jgi:capsule polysaccharide export protein KpsE/RkpR